jgi:hypothetical protein
MGAEGRCVAVGLGGFGRHAGRTRPVLMGGRGRGQGNGVRHRKGRPAWPGGGGVADGGERQLQCLEAAQSGQIRCAHLYLEALPIAGAGG